jgi:hypothetical protein
MGWAPSTYGEKRGAYRVLVRRPEGKIPFGRSKSIRDDNIQMYVQEVGWSAWTR